jgi:DNA polymerase bacteriophage-type
MAQILLHVDFETASRVNLKERGLDNYSKDPSTHVLMMAWAINDALPQVWFPQDGPLPEHIELMIRRKEVAKSAFNADFERTIFREVLKIETDIQSWEDPMINARYASIAGNLEFVGKVLGLDEDKAKLATGKKLIKLFCEPNKKGEFNTRIYELDNAINGRGLPVDMTFVRCASKIVEEERADLTKEFVELTGLENPNSVKQLLAWLKEHDYPYGSLGAKWVKKALLDTCMLASGRRALELRQLLAKSSTAKLEALAKLTGPDGYLRNQYVYGGAARTLRWSGRGFQPQNLPRPTVKDIPGAIAAILTGDREAVRKFGPPLEVVASCLRGALCANL